MNKIVVVSVVALTLALVRPAAAQVGCAPPPPPLTASNPAMKAYVDRFNALVSGDPDFLTGKMAKGWRALVADMSRDSTVPPDLRARGEIMLAASLQDDPGIEEGLAAALLAKQTAEAGGFADSPLHAEILSTLAVKEANAGKAADAVAHADAGLAETARHFGTQSWTYGRATMAAAIAYNAFGNFIGTERLTAQAEILALACLPPDNLVIGQAITGHAAILGTLGRVDESLAEGERAVAWTIAHARESDDVMPYALDNLGWSLRNAGRLRESEAVLRRAVDLNARYHPDDWVNRASVLGKFANVLAAEGRYREAEAMWLTTRQYYLNTHDLSNPLAGSGELRRAADTAQARGDLPLALGRREEAIALIASHAQPRHPELARARIEYASTLLLAGRGREALAVAEPAVEVIRSTAPPGDFKRLGAEIAFAQMVAGAAQPEGGYPIAAPIAAQMERLLLDTATSRGDLIRFAPTFSSSFGTVTRLALAAGREEEAFHALQLANLSDIVLVNADVAVRAAAADPQSHALIEGLQERVKARQMLDRERSFAIARHAAADILRIESAIHANDQAIAEATGTLDRVFPAFRAIGRPMPVTLAAYRARLGPDDILIAPVSLAGETLTIAVSRDGLWWHTTPVLRSRVTALVGRIRASIDASRQNDHARFDAAASRALAQILLPAALDAQLRRYRHIHYYASGPLATIPPALLVMAPLRKGVAPAWLIRSHRLSIPPALGGAPAASPSRRDTFLGVGGPRLGPVLPVLATRGEAMQVGDFGMTGVGALPALPHAARELRTMAAMFAPRQSRLLLADAATEGAVKSMQLDRFGVIAIATHGLLSDALPGLTQPALVLTPPHDPTPLDDGLLTAAEVANLHLDADLVILSACDTASGSDPQGASYSGLSSAFLQAGARALLVSHWPVRDDAAERITVATLAGTRRGLDRATALQRAMIALMTDRTVRQSANPAIWAPFVLVEH